MLSIKNMKLSNKILSGAVCTTIIACGIVATTYVSGMNIISYEEKWITPFESVITTEYNLGDGFTAKSTTTSVTTISSVRHSDERMFSSEQWNAILNGIADGSIVWED